VLYETDFNKDMELLDFGYSQSKWVAEQVVADARSRGLSTRIFRPALVSPSVTGGGNNFDIAVRLVAFMVNHGIGVDALNQVSFVPADIVANNIVAISASPGTANQTYHMVRDDYANMLDITNIITKLTGRQFEVFGVDDFVPELIRRCRKEDLLFPLLDFLVGSVDNITAMEFKRYDNSTYQEGSRCLGMGHTGSIARGHGQRHLEVHAPQGDYLDCGPRARYVAGYTGARPDGCTHHRDCFLSTVIRLMR
jgi:thioester reductase-like protein